MEKLFLIITPLRMVSKPHEPALGPLCLYSFALKNGFGGDLLDFNDVITEENISDYEAIVNTSLERWLSSHPEAKIIGISALFSGIFTRALKIARDVKKIRSDIAVVIGGNHPSIFPKEILENCPEIDYIVIGEGEEQFVSLLRLYSQGSTTKFEIDNGIAYKSDGKVVIKEKTRYIDELDSLGVTNYDQVNFANYHTPDMDTWYNPKNHDIICAMPIATSRACPYNCNFCSMNAVMGRKFRSKSNEMVLEELKILYYEHNIRYFRIIDDCSTFDKENSMKLFSAIIASGMNVSFEFYNGLSIRTLDDELIDALVEAGLLRGSLAIETGSNFLRNKIMNKNLSNEKIYEVYHHFEKKHPHVWLIGFFLIGLPEETVETLEDTICMIKNLSTIYPVFNIIVPFPGTRLWDQCVRDNLMLADIKDIWKRSFWTYPVSIDKTEKNEDEWCSESLNKTEQAFFVKPYNLSIEKLVDYYKKLLILKAESWQKIQQRKQLQSETY